MTAHHNITSISRSNQAELLEAFSHSRCRSLELIHDLESEDLNLQVEFFTSPPKWHLAHTTWFYETFILKQHARNYKVFKDEYELLFNSYYNAIGKLFPRDKRGFLTRPNINEVLQYRSYVDRSIEKFITDRFHDAHRPWLYLIELGMHHEYQHQELFLTDIKYSFYQNPTFPIFRKSSPEAHENQIDLKYISFSEGLTEIGMDYDEDEFCYDNETPKYQHFQMPFALANRHATNLEFLNFIEDGGYDRPEFWLSEGWSFKTKHDWNSPLYWLKDDDNNWQQFTLGGLQRLNPSEPVCHISYFEADAFARWAGATLPTEQMLEVAAKDLEIQGQFYHRQRLHPRVAKRSESSGLQDIYGKVWEWTRSPYTAYHGYKPARSAVGEYNGKFMCNQLILRGGSCLTQITQMRPSYRNFFYPHERWQMTGIRLAKEN